MKKYILYILLIFMVLPSVGQMPTNGDYCNWDWEDQDLENWKRATPSGWSRINPPFLPETPANGELYKIQETDDYTRAKGWELVWAQFGPSDIVNPYFILYNRYRGLLRAFFYLESYEAYSHTAVTLSYSYFSNKPGVLTAGDEYSVAPDKYLSNPADGDNMITVIIPKHGRTSWGVADLPMFLDKNMKNAIFRGATFEITFYGCGVYNAYIEGTQSEQDNEQNIQHTIIGNSSMYNSSSQKFELTGTKLAKQIKSESELQQYYNALANKIHTTSSSPDFLKDFKSTVKNYSALMDAVSGVTNFSPQLKVIMKLFKTFVGQLPDGSDSKTKSSGASIYYINLEGTITVSSVLGVNNFKIPGALANSGSKIAYYDYPLGLINIRKTPKVKVTKPYQRIPCNYQGSIAQNPFPVKSGYKGKYVKYRFDENIDIDYLSVPGMQILDIEYALICRPNGTGDRKYKVEDKNIAVVTFTNLSGQQWDGNVPNPVYRDLEKGLLELHDFGNEKQYFGTPFLEKRQLKGITIEVPEDTDVSIGVMVMLRSPVSDEPVIVKTSFLPDVELVNHNYIYQVCNNELPVLKYSDYYLDDIYITLTNNPNTSTYTAGEIVMGTGFVGKPNYTAVAVNIYPSNGRTYTYATPYAQVTDICARKSLKEEKILESPQEGEDPTLSKDITYELYPNPNRGVFEIKLSSMESKTDIQIFNTSGILVLSQQLTNFYNTIDLAGQPSGIYFVRIISDDNVTIKKVIVE